MLLTVIRNSLVNLGKAVKGLVLMSDELDKVGKALYDGKVPAKWLKKSFPSLKPLGSYFRRWWRECAFFRKWVDEGDPVHVSAVRVFLHAGVLSPGRSKTYARKHKVEIDKVDFDLPSPRRRRVVVRDEARGWGVLLRDAPRRRGVVPRGALAVRVEPKVLYCPAPGVHMMPAQVKDFKKYTHYSCPLYKTADRRGILSTTGHSTNFVMDIRMPCTQGNDHWIRRGACLLLSLKD